MQSLEERKKDRERRKALERGTQLPDATEEATSKAAAKAAKASDKGKGKEGVDPHAGNGGGAGNPAPVQSPAWGQK